MYEIVDKTSTCRSACRGISHRTSKTQGENSANGEEGFSRQISEEISFEEHKTIRVGLWCGSENM
jgi:hypothetical protein